MPGSLAAVRMERVQKGAWASGACERRVDGDRVTEYVLAKDWLSGRGPGERGADVNPLRPHPKFEKPPELPQYMSRDHLHDRNRENALYDPAQPGLETYVRVTRRRGPPEQEEALRQYANERRKEWEAKEAQHAKESNELLALRSMLMQGAMHANREANKRVVGARQGLNTFETKDMAPPSPEQRRAQQLHSKLGIDKVQLVTSPMHIDDTPLAGHNTTAMAPAPAPASAAPPKPAEASMRGGAWPVDMNYFNPPKTKLSDDKDGHKPRADWVRASG